MRRERHLVAVVGPTGSGKTAASIKAARWLDAEIVAADSRQVRREMRIGTAAPTDEELAAAPHHLVGIVDPCDDWALPDFLEAARAALEDVWRRGKTPLLVGGTGQYIWALLEGWRVPAVAPNPALREELERLAEDQGSHALHRRLAWSDPKSADRSDPRNVRRLVRAVEIVETTGQPVPPLEKQPPDFTWSVVGLEWPRDELHERVDRRAEEMYATGLVEETGNLIKRYGRDTRALHTIGYAQAAHVVEGEWPLDKAIARTKIETHRLIRMQGNWFSREDPRIKWVDGRDQHLVAKKVVRAATPQLR
jgi:tRNA dimethylallyltransferase